MAIQAHVLGNLREDCKQVTLGQTPALQFIVCSNRKRKDKNGEKVTDFVSVTYFTTSVAPYLLKGRKVMVSGELEANPWIGTQGNPNAGLQMVAKDIEFCGGREEAQVTQQPYQQAQHMQAAPQPQPQYAPPQPGGDMPF